MCHPEHIHFRFDRLSAAAQCRLRHEASKTPKEKPFVTWCLGGFVVSLRIGSKIIIYLNRLGVPRPKRISGITDSDRGEEKNMSNINTAALDEISLSQLREIPATRREQSWGLK
jgi:hypothetical protein